MVILMYTELKHSRTNNNGHVYPPILATKTSQIPNQENKQRWKPNICFVVGDSILNTKVPTVPVSP